MNLGFIWIALDTRLSILKETVTTVAVLFTKTKSLKMGED